jgi:ParB family chromosome partitioning protein
MKQRTLSPGIPMPPFQATRQESGSPIVVQETSNIASTASPPIQKEAPAGREMKTIQVGLIDPNPFAPREIYTPEMILQRAESLRKHGQTDPIHVIPNPDNPGRYIIADGWTRVQACIEHKVLDELYAEIHRGLSVKEAAWLGFEQNESREQHCDLDRAMFFEKMISAGAPPSQVAAAAGLTRQMLSLYRSFGKLPAEVIEIVRMHPKKFGAWAASELAKLSEKAGSRRAVTLAIQFAEEDRPVRWLVSQVQGILSPSHARGSKIVRQIRFGNGYFKQRGDKFEVAISVPVDQADEFAGKLEALLETVAKPMSDTDSNDQTESDGMKNSESDEADSPT